MGIREMTLAECLQALARARFARLACARENQPYIVPVSLVLHERTPGDACLYGFTTRGQKLDWMQANPLVCVEVDEVKGNDRWVSVVASGRFKELPPTPGSDEERLRAQERPHQNTEAMDAAQKVEDERHLAYQLLQERVRWWEPGSSAWLARPGRDPAEPYIPIYYKIQIDHVTGHESMRDQGIPATGAASSTGKLRWLQKALACVVGGRG